MKIALASLLLLAACGGGTETNNQAAAPAPAPKAAPQVESAQQLVRRHVGGTGELRFADARSGTRDGATVVCGTYEQGNARKRYIVVGSEDVFVEPEMQPGQMDRAFAEFCGDGERG